MNHPFNIHRPFLDALRRDGTPVVIYLVNGVKLEGEVDGFDDDAIILRRGRGGYSDAPPGGSSSHAQKRMIFRHAISTVFPLGPVRFAPEDRRTSREPYENRGYSPGGGRRRYPPQTRQSAGYSRTRPPEPGSESRGEGYSENYRGEQEYKSGEYQEEQRYEESASDDNRTRRWSEGQE